MELNNGSNSSKRPYELHSKATQEEHLWEKKILSIYVFYTPSLLIQEKEKEGEKKNSRLCNPVPTTSPPVPVQEMLVQPQTQNEFSATTSGIRGKKQLNVLWLLIT